jgi:homoserine dehydrogenase
MSGPPLRVAVLGAGVVGREVIRAFLERPEALRTADGAPLELVGVAVRDVQQAAEGGIPAHLLTDAPAHLVAAQATDIVVELMGGEEPARTILSAALGAGKSVVSANKLVLARHGAALEDAARRNGAFLRFEAAVGGGTPVLSPLAEGLGSDRLTRIRGIVNGTTNLLLTDMAERGTAYTDALRRAKRAGYAEADPASDVEGHDAAYKLVILARLGFGVWLDPDRVPRTGARADGEPGPAGILGVSPEDLAAATEAGLAIRLIARAELVRGGRIAAAVVPAAVPSGSAFGRTVGVGNRVEVEAAPIGRVAFEGPGAGGASTSSAILADLRAIARHAGSTWAGLAPARASADVAAFPAPRAGHLDAPSGARYPILD